jgi:hypothetical protein
MRGGVYKQQYIVVDDIAKYRIKSRIQNRTDSNPRRQANQHCEIQAPPGKHKQFLKKMHIYTDIPGITHCSVTQIIPKLIMCLAAAAQRPLTASSRSYHLHVELA